MDFFTHCDVTLYFYLHHGNKCNFCCTYGKELYKYSNNAKLPCVSFIYKCEKRQIDVKPSKLTSEVEN